VIIGLPAPLLPIHLLWINLVTDGLPALCLATDPIDSEVMTRHPRRRTDQMMDRTFLFRLLLSGTVTMAVAFGVYLYGLRTGSVEFARSMAFTSIVFIELLKSFSFRSETKPLWRMPLLGNIQLIIVVAVSFGFQIWAHHFAVLGHLFKAVLPPWPDRWLLLGLALIPLAVLELAKVYRGVSVSKRGRFQRGSR
jgi:Ca2+-transporting ATPase